MEYKLGLSRLLRKGDGPRRAEILLRQARDELRREEFGLALALADEAVEQLDDRQFPLVERSAHHVRALAALVEAEAAPLGVPRVVALDAVARLYAAVLGDDPAAESRVWLHWFISNHPELSKLWAKLEEPTETGPSLLELAEWLEETAAEIRETRKLLEN